MLLRFSFDQTGSANLQSFAEGGRGWGGVGGGQGSKNKLQLQNILAEFRVTLRNVLLSLSCVV